MAGLEYDVLKKLVFNCYGKCKYQKALEFAKLAAENFPDKMPQTSYWLACLYSRLKETSRAISILTEAINKKIWWSPKRLLTDEDLVPLQGLDSFKYIVGVCSEMQEKARASSKADILICTPSNYTNEGVYPLLVSIHWQNGNALEYSHYWRDSKALENFILAFPQSSQVSALNEYNWDDGPLAERELKEAYNKILVEYKIDRDKMVIAGTSQGAKLAIQLALENKENFYKGFIAVIPVITDRDIEYLTTLMKVAAIKGIRGSIIVGSEDMYYSNTIKLYEAFRRNKFPCKLIHASTVGHQFPDDFSKKIKIATRYIL